MIAGIGGVPIHHNLLPEGADDRVSIVPVRQTLARRGVSDKDLLVLPARRGQSQRASSQTHVSSTDFEADSADQTYELSSAEAFGYYSEPVNTLSAAAHYAFYARLFAARVGRSIDLYF
jgi:hypothetical protein